MCGKNFEIHGVHNPRKCIALRNFYSCISPLKTRPQFLSSRPRQKEITPPPRQHSFENLFTPTAERGGGNYDLLCLNSVNFFKCDGFTVL